MSAGTRGARRRWTPTFPRARYLISKGEFDYRAEQHAKTPLPHFGDSVLPVVEAGRAELVRDDYALDDHVRLAPTPGHTPHHVAVCFGRDGDDAIIPGDVLHSPLQAPTRTISALRCRRGCGGQDAPQLSRPILRHAHLMLYGSFPIAVDRANYALGRWVSRPFRRGLIDRRPNPAKTGARLFAQPWRVGCSPRSGA